MREIINDVDLWLAEGETAVGLATVVETWGSAPRQVGAKMAFTTDGRVSGSVSGGCVEGAVIEAGIVTLHTGRPSLLHFGVADEMAWDVGLACGGTIEIFVEPLEPAIYTFARNLLAGDDTGAIVTVIEGPEPMVGQKLVLDPTSGQLGTLPGNLDLWITDQVPAIRQSGRFQPVADVDVFVDILRPRPALIMVGGGHITKALARLASTVGFRTLIVDPRRVFGNTVRFPQADQVLSVWPAEGFSTLNITSQTAVVTLSHDPKIDDPALALALQSPAFFVGALGSRKSHAKRMIRLQKMGFSQEAIGRIRGPVGLDIGALTPEEIALSIMAEIVQAQRKTQSE